MQILDATTNQSISEVKKYFNFDSIILYAKTHMLSAAIAVIMIIFFRRISNICKRIMEKAFKRFFSENPGIATFIISILTFVIDFVLIVIILEFLGINLTGITALLGAFSLVIGFSFKDILSNFFGGLILLTFKPFQVNDVVEYKSFVGTIKKIEIFYTTLTNFQNEEVIVPNANIIDNEIININTNSHRRLTLQIGVGYGSNIDQVKDTIRSIIDRRKEDLFYIEDTEPVIGMYEIGASSLNFDIRVFVRENQYMNARYYLNESIKTEFDKLGIDLPYNIIDLQVNPGFNSINITENRP